MGIGFIVVARLQLSFFGGDGDLSEVVLWVYRVWGGLGGGVAVISFWEVEEAERGSLTYTRYDGGRPQVSCGKSGSGGGIILPVGLGTLSHQPCWHAKNVCPRPNLSTVIHRPLVASTPSRLVGEPGPLTTTHQKVPRRTASLLGDGLGMDSDPASFKFRRPTTRR
jgi:hypothetical protein